MGFVHLHVHSQFSLLDGTMDPGDLAKAAAARGMDAVAMTDTVNLFGAVSFYKACKKQGIKAILGAELHVQPEGVGFRDPARQYGGYQLIALVENQQGYHSLCALITAAIFDGAWYKPRVDLELIRKHREGLIFLTGSLRGPLGGPVVRDDLATARGRLRALHDVIDADHLFVELTDVGLPNQREVNAAARRLADELSLQTVVTNSVHYRDPEDAGVHELLTAIAQGVALSDDKGLLTCPTDQAYLKTEEELRGLFPEDGPAIDRTVDIAARCDFHFDFSTYHFPATTPPDVGTPEQPADTDANWEYFARAFPPPRDYGLEGVIPPRPEGAGNMEGYFRWYASRGLDLRLERIAEEKHPAYWERLEIELSIIEKMGFPAYLLIVAEFINWSKDEGIPVGPGRGSAAGSLVAYAMRITDIDPLRFDLLFERFLNPARVSMPDIDVDFCQDRREEVIEHVRRKYGAEYVSQIITYGTLKAKAAVRDVSRALRLMFTEADRIAKLVPDTLGIKLAEAIDQVPALQVLRERDPKVRRVLSLAQRVEGMCRQTSVHAAGVVIADKPLVAYAPLYRDEPEGGPVVQYDMKSAESIGLIKFDFLGLKTLDQIRDTLNAVSRNHGVDVDMAALPTDDESTYTLLQRGDTLGIFQLESSGMRELLTRLRPSVLDDLVALVALYRPGPLSSGMTDDFVDRKHGRKEVVYPLPQLEPILNNTYGTIVYQEQVMQIAQVMAGYSLGEADLLRRAMGKKKKEEMDKQRARFLSGSIDNDIPEERAAEIFDLLAKFAAYGFNKSHSAAYGYISYQTAWLKAHYRPEFMAALMTSEAVNTDKLVGYIRDCRAAGVDVRPVCINHSNRMFEAVHGEQGVHIRFGMGAVKNVGDGAVEAIVAAREEVGGAFTSAFEVFERIDYKAVNRRVLEMLIKVGGFDVFGVPRMAMLETLEAAMSAGLRRQEEREAGQGSLFALLGEADRPADFSFPPRRRLGLSERLAYEKEGLGLYLTGHPMQAHANDVARFATVPLSELEQFQLEQEVRLAGLTGEIRTIRTKRGDRMAFVQLEDCDDSVECVLFSDAWARSQKVFEAGTPVLVTGTLESRNGELKLKVASVELLSEVRARSTTQVEFHLEVDELTGRRLTTFKDMLEEQHGGCAATVVLSKPGFARAYLGLPFGLEVTAALEERVHALFERPDVVMLS